MMIEAVEGKARQKPLRQLSGRVLIPISQVDASHPVVYRLFSRERILLYIGMTRRHVAERIAQHKRDKSWWPEVAFLTLQECDNAENALKVEAKAINEESPLYNSAVPSLDVLSCRLCVACRREFKTYNLSMLYCRSCFRELARRDATTDLDRRRRMRGKRRANGEGSVYRATDGRWVARISLGTSPETGKPLRKVVYARTETKAKHELTLLRIKYHLVADV